MERDIRNNIDTTIDDLRYLLRWAKVDLAISAVSFIILFLAMIYLLICVDFQSIMLVLFIILYLLFYLPQALMIVLSKDFQKEVIKKQYSKTVKYNTLILIEPPNKLRRPYILKFSSFLFLTCFSWALFIFDLYRGHLWFFESIVLLIVLLFSAPYYYSCIGRYVWISGYAITRPSLFKNKRRWVKVSDIKCYRVDYDDPGHKPFSIKLYLSDGDIISYYEYKIPGVTRIIEDVLKQHNVPLCSDD